MAERVSDDDRSPRPAPRVGWPDPLPPAPTVQDFLAGGHRRDAFLHHLRTAVPRDLRDRAMNALFALLPLPVASAFGGWIGRRIAARTIAENNPRYRLMCANLRLIAPDLPDDRHPAAVLSFYETFGRLFAEMPHMGRLARRMRIVGEDLLAASPDRPLVLVGIHTGNWEVVAAKASQRGTPLASIAIPLPQRARRQIVTRYRTRAGAILIDPSPQGLRQSLALLKRGGRQVVFCDEPGPDGVLRAPFFGRPADPNANLAVAARLARKTGARLVVFHVRRGRGLDMVLTFGPEIDLPPASPGRDPTGADMAAVNAAIEPIVRANVDQWYWLDTRIR